MHPLLVFLFPCIIVVVFNRSFVSGLVFSLPLPGVIERMFRCPLCLGFHVSWVWFLLTAWIGIAPWITAVGFLPFVLASSVVCYVVEHVILLIEAVKDRAELDVSIRLQQIQKQNDSE